MRRRDLMRGALATIPWAVAGGRVEADGGASAIQEGAGDESGLIVRQWEPRNLESTFSKLDGPITPNAGFYVRSHFATPSLESGSHQLAVEGRVAGPIEIGMEELRGMPSKSVAALMECAGNGRVFLTPKASGLLWGPGAVGNAEWTGVPLSAVLERAGVEAGAVEVILEGADSGSIDSDPKSPGTVHYARSLPIAKARADVLLAYAMNGEDLPASHGYPLRAVVPGWYGMASVKWLRRIIVTDRPFSGFFQTLDYSYFERRDGLPSLVPVTALQVKAQIARPAYGEAVESGKAYRVQGAAWSGDSEVAKVEVSTDGGQSWSTANLVGEPSRNSWRLWEFDWKVPETAGTRTLMARATDASGRSQPMERDKDRRTYMINHVLPIEVRIR